MWLDWIVEEGKNLFAEMILWLEKFAPLDERMPEEFGKRDWDRQESISDTKLDDKESPNQIQEKYNGMDANISPIWQMKAIATPTVQLIENNLGENDTTENIQNRIVFAKWIQHMPIEEQEFLQNQNQPSLTRGINFLEDEEWLDMNTEKMPQRSIEMKQSQVNIQKAEPPMGMEQGIQINHMDREEPQVMEQATTKIDIDLLLDRLEKRLWANRQRGYNRTVLR